MCSHPELGVFSVALRKEERRCAEKSQNIIDISTNSTDICKNSIDIFENISDILSFFGARSEMNLRRG